MIKQEDITPGLMKESDQERPKEISKENTDLEGRKERVKWPTANSKEWIKFDEDVTKILKVIHSSHENKAEVHPRIIYNIGKDRFGIKEVNQKSHPSGPSKRQKKCKELRKEIKKLTQAYKNAPEEGKDAINELVKEKLKQACHKILL